MAALTWKNVDGPDFRGTLEGFKTSGELLDNAAKGWQRQMTALDKAAIDQEALRNSQFVNQQAQSEQAALNAANPAIQRYLIASQNGNKDVANAELAGLGNIDPATFRDLTTTGTSRLRTAQADNLAEQNRLDTEAVSVFNIGMKENAVSPEAQLAYMNANMDKLTPRQQALLKQSNAGLYAVGGGSPAGSPVGATDGALKAPGLIAGVVSNVDPNETNTKWAERVELALAESGGRWDATNKQGYGGRLQFGTARLADAAAAGVIPKGMTGLEFAKQPEGVQRKVENWHFDNIDKIAKENGLEKYYGKTVDGVLINRDSIRGMAHIGGNDGVRKFITTNGEYNPKDFNKTSIRDYGLKFGGNPNALQAPSAGQVRDIDSNAASVRSDLNYTGIVADIAEAEKKTGGSLQSVTMEAIGKGGELEGWSAQKAGAALQAAATASKSRNPYVALALVKQSLDAPEYTRFVPDFVDRFAGWDQFTLNKGKLEENSKMFLGGGVDKAVSVLGTFKEEDEQATVLKSNLDAAKVYATNLERQVEAGRTGIAGEAKAAREKANALEASYAISQGQRGQRMPDRLIEQQRTVSEKIAKDAKKAADDVKTSEERKVRASENGGNIGAILIKKDVEGAKEIITKRNFNLLPPDVQRRLRELAAS